MAADGEHEMSIAGNLPDGRFPKLNDVFPKPSKTRTSVFFDARMLSKVLASIAEMAESNDPVRVEFTTDGMEHPIVIRHVTDARTTTAVVVPMPQGK
jgi:hypothetical protein